ncbi:MAG: GNAT family N-acetyltransferase [Amnibacterium sp.]
MTDVTTERLVLHPIRPDEAARIVAGDREPDWHPAYPFEDELDPLRGLAAATDPDPVFTLYQVRERASGLAVGGIGFFGPPDADGAVELGYGLVAAARGGGLATEALLAAVGIAAAHGATAVRADTEPGNAASQRVLAKAGFAETGRTATQVRFERRLRRGPAARAT